jgi:hypothetical protein
MKMLAAGLMLGGILFAQSAPSGGGSSSSQKKTGAAGTSTAKKSASGTASKTAKASAIAEWRSECSKAGGFCVQVPLAWKSLGEVFDGAGFVVAEPDATKPQDDWNQITAAATDMPEAADGHERPSTDELIDIILGSPSSGIHAQTLQRSRMMLAGMPAEVLKVRLKAAEASTDAIEFIALLDDGETVYSVAVGCAPADAARLEPVFDHVLHSWKATAPAAVPNESPTTTTPPAPATPPKATEPSSPKR